MTKRNKMRYQSRGNLFPPLVLTGKWYLRYRDEDAIKSAEKGDLQLYLSTESLAFNTHIGDYEAMGHAGYVRADVYDGKGWRFMSLEEFFPDRIQYFGKRERPIDTIAVAAERLEAQAGAVLQRTYREHYVLMPEGVKPEEEDEGES